MTRERAVLSPEEIEINHRHRATQFRATVLGAVVSIASMLGLAGGAVAWLARGGMATTLAEMVQPAVDKRVDQRISPFSEGVKTFMRESSANLEDEIAELRRRDRQGGLDELDTQRLVRKQREQRAYAASIDAIERAERNNRGQ